MMETTEKRIFLVHNMSESMFIDKIDEYYLDGKSDIPFEALKGKEVICLVSNRAIIERINSLYGLKIPYRESNGIKRIKLQQGDLLYIVSPVDGMPVLGQSTLPTGLRLRLNEYKLTKKSACCSNH